MEPSKGLRFYHSRVLDSIKYDGKSAQMYEVSAIRCGKVYYKPVYNYGTREALGKSEYCSTETFPRIAGPVIECPDCGEVFGNLSFHCPAGVK